MYFCFLAKPPSGGREPLALSTSHHTSHRPPQAHPGHTTGWNSTLAPNQILYRVILIMGPWGAVCENVMQHVVLGGPDLLFRPIHGSCQAETRHWLLTKIFTGADGFWDPGVPCVKFSSNILCLKAPGSCPGSLSQAPKPLPAGAVSISTLSLPAGEVSISTLSWLRMLRQGPLGVFRLQSSRLAMQAESSYTNLDELYGSSLVKCS